MDVITILTCITIFLIAIIYIFQKWAYGYWKRRGLEYLEPNFFFGNSRDLFKKKFNTAHVFAKWYEELKKRGYKHGGCYMFFRPIYIPVDLDFIKNIMAKNFDHFVNHGVYYNEKRDPLSAHLFSLEDEKWRKLRAKMTPTFTSGKIKMMFQKMFACSAGLKDILDVHAKVQDAIDIKEILSRFTTDIIGSVAFGIECNSLRTPSSKFRENSKKLFNSDWNRRLRVLITLVFPKSFLMAVNFKFMDTDMENFYLNVIRNTIEYRETNNIFRKDFMHLMIQLKNRGKVTDDEFITKQDGEEDGPDFLTFNELAAQCFIFFMAGYETSATTMTFILLELALNQDIQEKLRMEILTIMKKHGGELTYDAIMEMKYLEKVVYETLRKHPPAPVLVRKCTKSYQVPDTEVVIEKGTSVFISAMAIQNDPEYYPNPEKFDPERFTEENKAKRHSCAFLSFGEGPRFCIGSRFALLQTKVGITSILSNFRVNLHKDTKLPITHVTKAFILAVDGEVWLTVSRIN